ncbi:hypothetical protein CCZ01_03440 [Helicobacter monodelphidis]|uniref:site-2 protease family protein n=1 Tax=Helicobacter sp. 15-1451 TaxID=2004995 RepID=UPI000DCE1286|nr:site-2 protease family protein [Helicobacter sp. 15-1451]RAX58139.1 hypothetical protein CCZ01_03440 [Helicobacter sp. 15-1451]
MFENFDIAKIIIAIGALIIAIVGHELMHGLSAYHYGDNTAKHYGRLTINPISHIDPIGTLILPLMLFLIDAPFLFGWAKPVPVNTEVVYKNGGYNALTVVALAGISYNFLVALLVVMIWNFLPPVWLDDMLGTFLEQLLLINVVLAVINLLPFPSFDGAHALCYQLSRFKLYAIPRLYERIGMMGGTLAFMLCLAFEPTRQILFVPVQAVLAFLLHIGTLI